MFAESERGMAATDARLIGGCAVRGAVTLADAPCPPSELEAMMRRAARTLGLRLPKDLHVAFRPMADAYFRTHARQGSLRVAINDAFERAPRDALEALAEVIVERCVGKGSGRRVGEAFWEWVRSPEVVELMEGNYLERQRSFVAGARGAVWDLAELFDDVNRGMFGGRLPRPVLAWTAKPLTYRWGWYSDMVRPHGVLVLNRLLDDAAVPRRVLEATMYHEMLHMVVPPEHVEGRRVVHTRAFNEQDRKFPGHAEMREEYKKVLARYVKALRAARAVRRGLRRR